MPEATTNISFEQAELSQLPAIQAFLAELGWPVADVGAPNQSFIVARDGDALVGCVGLEMFGKAALLRSLAVSPSRQGKGIGKALFQRAMAEALARGAKAMYLLTTTEERLFTKFGFKRLARDEVPDGVRASAELSFNHPGTAVYMGIRVK